jgi:hypothetical protein
MVRAVKVVLVLLCLAAVLALCIAPWVDPPETTLKSFQIIFFLMSVFAACAFWLIGLIASEMQGLAEPMSSAIPIFDDLSPRRTSCVQRC